jgi:hypothetical protein
MLDQRISRRSLLAGAAGTSALLTSEIDARPGPRGEEGHQSPPLDPQDYVEPTNKAIEASAQRWAQKHRASVTM